METLEAIRASLEENFSDEYRLVYGDGVPNARILLIGEAPGRMEVEQGKPFVGAAGKNLTAFLQVLEVERKDLYITNAVKFRPTRPGKRGEVNRPPTRQEIDRFRPYLLREIESVQPQIVVTLGNTALYAVLGKNEGIGEMHGRAHTCQWGMLFPLYHPASVIYNRALNETYHQDLLTLAEIIKKNKEKFK